MLVRRDQFAQTEPAALPRYERPLPPPGGMLDPGGVWLLFRRRRGLIATVLLATLSLAVLFILEVPPKYDATAVVLVDPRQQRVVQSDAVLPGIGNDSAAVESQVEVIQSTTLANRVIRQFRLDEDPELAQPSKLGALLDSLRIKLGGTPLTEDQKVQRLLARFEDNLKVRRRGVTYVLEVGFVSRDPVKAARIANAVAEGYLASQASAKTDATAQASGWLDTRLEDLKRQASAAERAVADYKARNSLVDTGERRSIIEQQLGDLNQQLVQARVHTSEVQARYDQMRKVSANSVATGGLPEALQSQVILALRTQYAQAAREQADLAQVLGSQHPSIKAAQAEVDALRGQIAGEISRISAGLRNELEAARGRERSLEASLTALKGQSAATDQANVKLRELERDAETTRTVLGQFMLRFKETSEQQSLQTADARIISPASPPPRPSSPNAALVLALAAIGGLGLGLCTAAAADGLKRGIRTVREAESLLSMPVLGMVQGVSSGLPLRQGPMTLPAPTRQRRAKTPLTVEKQQSAFAEAMRGLAIRLRTTSLEGPQVVLVTSASRGEGASTIASGLANALARTGTSTLLIEADVRRPSRGGDGSRPGLVQALGEDLPLFPLIGRDPGTGLYMLPTGPIRDATEASERLTGVAMDRILGHLRSKFDVVVLDGAPVLAYVDSRYLLELSDAALLVVEWAKTDRRTVLAAVEATGANADKFTGTVLNKVDFAAYRLLDGSAARLGV